jgi:hypothetical protein
MLRESSIRMATVFRRGTGRREHEHRAEQADHEERDRTAAQRGEERAGAAVGAGSAAVAGNDEHGERRGRGEQQPHERPGGVEGELPLLEERQSVLEQQLEHGIRGGGRTGCRTAGHDVGVGAGAGRPLPHRRTGAVRQQYPRMRDPFANARRRTAVPARRHGRIPATRSRR